ncbi:hypothetical protein QFC21_005314 [Naganishia friedmannii]|uniref:Uncharacterized protein n=1 Tax=Naganishia friedmannii TaxID=89922 RepID=A0ACC2VAE8_9TREE|nr:hypothetical protein QFC21_005314 [Naganishia friedmannii]
MPAHTRHFRPPTIPLSPLPLHIHLETSLTHLVTQYPPPTLLPAGGLYAGLLGIVYLFYRLSDLLPSDYKIQGKTVLQWQRGYWAQAERYERELLGDHGVAGVKVRPWRCGVGDDTVVYAALHVVFAIEDDNNAEAEVEAFCKAVTRQLVGRHADEQSKKHGKSASNEWLYGRAGTLFLLRLVRNASLGRQSGNIDDNTTITLNTIDSAIRAVVREIVAAPRPWIWHGNAYLGAVHGSAGIIAQVLLSIKAISGDSGDHDEEKKWIATMEPDVGQLLDVQFTETGNWPSSLASAPGRQPRDDRLLQFCHGSPGIIACLSHILPFYPHLSTRIKHAITLAQPDLFARGLLTKEPCLCHGATGNALALHDQKQREAFLAYTTEEAIREMEEGGLMRNSESPEGLYTGLAGRVWAWALGASRGFDKAGTGNFAGFDDF